MPDDSKKVPTSKRSVTDPDPEIEALNEVEREELIDAIKDNEPEKISSRFAAQHQLENEKRTKVIMTVLAVLLGFAIVGVVVLGFLFARQKSDIASKNDEISSLQSSKSSGVTKLEKQLETLKDDKKSLEEELKESGKSSGELEADLAEAEEEVESLKEEVATQKAKIRSLESDLAEARAAQSSGQGTRAGGAPAGGSATN